MPEILQTLFFQDTVYTHLPQTLATPLLTMELMAYTDFMVATNTPPPEKNFEFLHISRPTVDEVGWARAYPCQPAGIRQ